MHNIKYFYLLIFALLNINEENVCNKGCDSYVGHLIVK